MPKLVGLIPLRGGSQRIPNKNVKPIAGKPLAYWVCSAAKRSRYIDEVYVSTEDQHIAQIVRSFDLGVEIVERPHFLATHASSTDDVIRHFTSKVAFDVLATIQATSPLLSSDDLDRAIEQFLADDSDSLVTGVLLKRFVWSVDGRPLNYDPTNRPFTQEFQGSIMENGAFYLTKRHIIERHCNRLGGKIGIFRMSAQTAVELDQPDDWEQVEHELRNTTAFLATKAKEIKLIVTDFDGVWTDNKVYTLGSSLEGVCCSKADSLGLEAFRSRAHIPMLVVSKEKNDIVASRCAKLNLDVILSVDDKCAAIGRELAVRDLTWKNVCYIGNDINDLECMSRAGLTFCPSDSVSEVKWAADYILFHSGGNGAVREMLERLQRTWTSATTVI